MNPPSNRKTPGQTIVVVEDEHITAEDLRRRLESWGYRVQGVAASGEEAIRMTEATKPDLVLMDIHLKGPMDGVEAARLIKARSNTPVIYASSFSDPATLRRAHLTDPSGMINKPYNDHEMRSAIASALSKHTMERQIAEAEDRYRRLLATSSDMIFLRKRRRILSANGAAIQSLEYPLAELLRQDLPHFAARESVPLLTLVLDEVEKGRAHRNVEVLFRTKSGLPLTVAFSADTCMHHGESAEQIVLTALTRRGVTEEEEATDSPRVLIADDEETNRTIARLMMENLGFVVDVVTDGHAAVEAARTVPYAMILLDCWMPGLDGFSAGRAIRSMSLPSPSTRVVAMSADMRDGDRQRCLDAGMDDTISKPFTMEQMRSLLSRSGL